MNLINQRLVKALRHRAASDTLRTLNIPQQGIDFYSNDYLGLAQHRAFQNILLDTVTASPSLLCGATGSRLISGNSEHIMRAEHHVASVHETPSALLFPSGFMANMALFSTLPQRGDTVLMDQYVHRSVRDGARLSAATCYKFRHNDLDHLERRLKKAKGTVFIAVESLYSMEGDFADLDALTQLAAQYGAALIVDEAHAFGVFGYGRVAQKKLQEKVFATLVTYGKAMGLQGAAILGSRAMTDYLVNHAAAFIYTTAMSDAQAGSIQKGYEFLSQHPALARTLQERIGLFRSAGFPSPSRENSPIQTLIIPHPTSAKALQQALQQQQLLTFAAVAPTVPVGRERLRICLHAFNTAADVNQLIQTLRLYSIS